jgi:endonuclease/exonuclease/phosphatase family metal-dependent hydrolase
MKIFLTIFLLLPFIFIQSQSNFINLDEDITDWDNIASAAIDEQFAEHVYDFKELKITNDQNYLYLLISFYDEILFQENNEVTLYLDADNSDSTGFQFEKIGAELVFTFGQRSGYLYSESGFSAINHFDIGLVSSPTVTSSTFEIAISRFDQNSAPFEIDTLRLLLSGGSGVADLMPNDGIGVEYIMTDYQSEMNGLNINKVDQNDLRVLSFNVHWDDIFDPIEQPAFERQLKAIDPDIIGFQEIGGHTSEETADLITQWLGGMWYNAKASSDIIVVSKYPIITYTDVGRNGAFLIDLKEPYGRELLIINAHPPCCRNDIGRQDEMDEFMAFVRDSKEQISDIPIDFETPIIVMGDMNMVGFNEQQRTILDGDIKNNSKYGPDFTPDWDGTSFEDSKPWTSGRPMQFTWYNEFSEFSPGRLDYIVYSGSAMTKKNSFVLFTKGLSDTELLTFGLEADDNVNSSDHLPVVADFEFTPITNIHDEKIAPEEFLLEQNYSNPFNPTTNIQYNIPAVHGRETFEGNVQNVRLKICDILGREVATLVNETQQPGIYKVEWNAGDLPSGIYFYELSVEDLSIRKKMLLIK